MTTVYFTNHQKRQLVDFLKKSLREKCPNAELFFIRISLRIQSKCRKYGQEITPYLDTFFSEYSCIIYVKISLNVNFESLHLNKTKSSSALTLKFSNWGKYITTKRSFKRFWKNNVFLKRSDKNCFRSITCHSIISPCSYKVRYNYGKSSQHCKLL